MGGWLKRAAKKLAKAAEKAGPWIARAVDLVRAVKKPPAPPAA